MRKLFLWDLRKQSGKKNLNKQMSKESQVINLVCDFFMATPVSPEKGLSCQEAGDVKTV